MKTTLEACLRAYQNIKTARFPVRGNWVLLTTTIKEKEYERPCCFPLEFEKKISMPQLNLLPVNNSSQPIFDSRPAKEILFHCRILNVSPWQEIELIWSGAFERDPNCFRSRIASFQGKYDPNKLIQTQDERLVHQKCLLFATEKYLVSCTTSRRRLFST